MSPEERIDAALADLSKQYIIPGSILRPALHAAARAIRDAERERAAILVERQATVCVALAKIDDSPTISRVAANLCGIAAAIRAGDGPVTTVYDCEVYDCRPPTPEEPR